MTNIENKRGGAPADDWNGIEPHLKQADDMVHVPAVRRRLVRLDVSLDDMHDREGATTPVVYWFLAADNGPISSRPKTRSPHPTLSLSCLVLVCVLFESYSI
jgi:hypothetical protein